MTCPSTYYGRRCDFASGHAGHHEHDGLDGFYRWDDSGRLQEAAVRDDGGGAPVLVPFPRRAGWWGFPAAGAPA